MPSTAKDVLRKPTEPGLTRSDNEHQEGGFFRAHPEVLLPKTGEIKGASGLMSLPTAESALLPSSEMFSKE